MRARGERRFELPRLVTLPLYLEWLGSRDPQVEDGALARVVDRHARLKVNGERQRPHVKERAHRIARAAGEGQRHDGRLPGRDVEVPSNCVEDDGPREMPSSFVE